jgi:hypothetical protein
MQFSRHYNPIVSRGFDFHLINGAFSHEVKEIGGCFFQINRQGGLQKKE